MWRMIKHEDCPHVENDKKMKIVHMWRMIMHGDCLHVENDDA